MQEVTKFDGTTYWKYILLYTNNCFRLSENPEKVVRNKIVMYFMLKESSINPLEKYFEGKIMKVHLDNGFECWD